MTHTPDTKASPILTHYAMGQEEGRLQRGPGELERVRTKEILERYLPEAPANIVDVGGGPGAYASWLVSRGYTVALLDVVPLHVEQARAKLEGAGPGSGSADVGDARQLPFAAASQDAVLLLGPLYHLTAREERLAALREAWRVLRPGGLAVVAAISRFASLCDAFFRGFASDPVFVEIVKRDLATGRHENLNEEQPYFTTAYFHHPSELPRELQDADFDGAELLAVEGPFWCLQNFESVWQDDVLRERLLGFLRSVESDQSLIGASAHMLCVARKPAS